MTKKRLAAIGECMLEFFKLQQQDYQLSFAGDTYNVALYCRRCSDFDQLEVDYVTALGDDPYSQMMLDAWKSEGIGVDYVRRMPGRMPGLYLIDNDESGERHFNYYRSESPARNVFDDVEGDNLIVLLQGFDVLYLSGISVGILLPESRQKLYDLLTAAKAQGTVIIFDNNYRPKLWRDVNEARQEFTKILRYVDIALPSFDDARHLFGDETPEDTAIRLRDLGVAEMVIKSGHKGYYLVNDDIKEHIAIESVKNVVDTTAAGDSFNGAFLAKHLSGMNIKDSAAYAAKVAAVVIQHKGAILPKSIKLHDI